MWKLIISDLFPFDLMLKMRTYNLEILNQHANRVQLLYGNTFLSIFACFYPGSLLIQSK